MDDRLPLPLTIALRIVSGMAGAAAYLTWQGLTPYPRVLGTLLCLAGSLILWRAADVEDARRAQEHA